MPAPDRRAADRPLHDFARRAGAKRDSPLQPQVIHRCKSDATYVDHIKDTPHQGMPFPYGEKAQTYFIYMN